LDLLVSSVASLPVNFNNPVLPMPIVQLWMRGRKTEPSNLRGRQKPPKVWERCLRTKEPPIGMPMGADFGNGPRCVQTMPSHRQRIQQMRLTVSIQPAKPAAIST
jgi:hypothetical protein